MKPKFKIKGNKNDVFVFLQVLRRQNAWYVMGYNEKTGEFIYSYADNVIFET